MIQIGDTVKVIGTTSCGAEKEVECIKIGTICKVIQIENGREAEVSVEIKPIGEYAYSGRGGYWYLEKDVEKGHLEWVKDE